MAMAVNSIEKSADDLSPLPIPQWRQAMNRITSNLLEAHPSLRYRFTTRQDGCSLSPFDTNNLAFHVGDDPASVMQNHHALAKALGYDIDCLIHMRQIHSDRVVHVDTAFRFDDPPECDALITATPGIALMVMVADCTPVLMVDPVNHAIAAVHAGRAGAFKNIIARTLGAMQKSFGSDPRSILAVLGPSICQPCYEVNEAIASEAAALGHGNAIGSGKGHLYLDVRKILTTQLCEAGVPPDNIEQLARCSSCENDTLFSYRADGGTTGRMAGVIMLKNP